MASRQNTTRRLHMTMVGIACVLGAFVLGIQSAGDVRTVASLVASTPLGDGDFTEDGVTDLADVIHVLEIVRGFRDATAADFSADPNGDGLITIDDALSLLHTFERQ